MRKLAFLAVLLTAVSSRAEGWAFSIELAPRWMREVVEPDNTEPTLEGTPAGLAIGVARRFGWLEAGARIDGAAGYTALHLLGGVEAGLAIPAGKTGLVELLGEAGLHEYYFMGGSLGIFGRFDISSASARVPYAGGRLAAGWLVAPHARFSAGVFARRDLRFADATQIGTSCFFWWCNGISDHYRVGGWEAGPTATLSAEF